MRRSARVSALHAGAITRVVIAALAMIATLVIGGKSAHAGPKAKPNDITTIVVVDRDYDPNGNFIGESRHEWQTNASSGSVDADAGNGSGIGTMGGGAGGYIVQSASGCRKTTIGFTRKSAWNQFSMSHTKQYCWGSGRVSGWNWQGDPASWTSFNNIDGQHILRGTSYNAYYLYYSSAYGASNYGAHYTRATMSVETCVSSKGCMWTEYPFIEITVRNNGTYRWHWYDGDGQG